jgi:hypothetical protein
VINTKPRPRLLIRGFANDPELVERLLALAPTSKLIESLRDVRQAEWDILVTDQQPTEPAPNHYGSAVQLDPGIGVVLRPRRRATWEAMAYGPFGRVLHEAGHISTELRRCRGLPQRIADLTHEQLEPILLKREQHAIFSLEGPEPDGWQPFIETATGHALAARLLRSEQAEQWLLPRDTPDLTPWVKAALAEWHTLAPDRFPGVPDWSHADIWSTAEERRLRGEMVAVREAATAALQKLEQRQGDIKRQLDETRDAADAYERRLLTAQGDELRVAVMQALRELGLTVTDADADADPGDDLEDMRAQDPDEPTWEALVEVKGYSKGAKTEAIGQFMRFQKRYMARTGRLADAEWYVVNQFFGRDPSSRQKVLQGNQGDVDAFAGGGGLVIDTVVLFQVLMDVRAGSRTPQEVRTLLRTSTGRLELPEAKP